MTATTHGVSATRRRHALLGGGVLALAWLIARTAWVSDDAFISLRTAANWLHGYGPTWNVDERVQTFTHPLWLFLLTGAHALTGEPFYSTLWLSIAVSTAAIATLAFAAPGGLTEKGLSLFVLAFSQAFVDFSSSGLENPLTHLLLAAFAFVYLTRPASPARSAWLAAIAGLCALNRLDTVLLVAPALAANVASERGARGVARIGWAIAPLALWEVFSVVYYGFPFPNTAYAKLAQGQGTAGERIVEGLVYLGDSLLNDPITLCAIAACAAISVYRRDKPRTWLLAGAIVYVVYTIRIGGDFMRGRFLSAPLFVSMFCLATSDWLRSEVRGTTGIALAAALVAALLGHAPPPFTGADYGASTRISAMNATVHDERGLFFAVSSLRNASKMNPSRADHPWVRSGRVAKAAAARDPAARVRVVDAIGYAGYYAGPGVHLIDRWALADALLARLPAAFGRYGHYPRVIPSGYLETLRSRANLISDPGLAAYYGQLALVTRGPLWSARRWRAIWNLNTGVYAKQIDAYTYSRAPRFAPHVRLHNPTRYPCVIVYVWNNDHLSNYVLDVASELGKSYEVDWEIAPSGARLLNPPLQPVSSLPELAPRGWYTISVGFLSAPAEPVRALYELRYAYSISGAELVTQRHGWPVSNRDMPNGAWSDGDVDGVIQVVPEK